MCGRYTVNTEDEIIELREILQEISRRLMQENAEDENKVVPAAVRNSLELIKPLDSGFLRQLSSDMFGKISKIEKPINALSENISSNRSFTQLTFDSLIQETIQDSANNFTGNNNLEYDWNNKTEAYPSCLAPVILPDREVKFIKWGFPKWDGKGVIFNARSEGVSSSKLFSPHLEGERCLVPASSYFEWTRIGNKPTDKYRIFTPESRFIFMAGLLRKNINGELEYVIITRAAAENIRFIHSRMPVVLKIQYALEWLNGVFSDELIELLGKISEVRFAGVEV